MEKFLWACGMALWLSLMFTHPRSKISLLAHGFCWLFGIPTEDEPPQNIDRFGGVHGLGYRRDEFKLCPRCGGSTFDPNPHGEPESEYRPAPQLDQHGKPTGKFLCRDCGGYGDVPIECEVAADG